MYAGLAAALFVGFAFVPTENFNIFKPAGSVTDYLIPVLRSQVSSQLQIQV